MEKLVLNLVKFKACNAAAAAELVFSFLENTNRILHWKTIYIFVYLLRTKFTKKGHFLLIGENNRCDK